MLNSHRTRKSSNTRIREQTQEQSRQQHQQQQQKQDQGRSNEQRHSANAEPGQAATAVAATEQQEAGSEPAAATAGSATTEPGQAATERAWQPQQHPERTQDQQRVWQSTWQEHRARSWQSDHRSWQQRGGYNGYRIPEDRYRGYFGPQHWFRISGQPFAVYGGYPRFQYEGYWITLLDPWPEYWSNDWYDNDDVYVDYRNDGYYMYNRRYPGAGIAISISM